jgi:hypothetical protein
MMGDSVASPERRAFVGGLLGSTGLGNNGVGVVDATPAGGLLGLQEAGQAGDRTGMALAAAGMLPGAGVAEKVAAKAAERSAPAAERFITAYHGSPHSFDKFSLDKIGTGEGAQVYGHGLYFADNEKVAKSYQDSLSDGFTSPPRWFLKGVEASPNSPEAKAATIVKELGPAKASKFADRTVSQFAEDPRMTQELAFWQNVQGILGQGVTKKDVNQKYGHMYQVRINADPEHFLDWDKLLSEQPKAVEAAKALEPMLDKERRDLMRSDFNKLQGSGLLNYAKRATGSDAAASEFLRQQGLPGIKYLDQGSRGVGEGSRNYVVFDDSLVNILKKYGLVGLLGGGTAYGSSQQQQQGAPVL